MIDCHIDIPRYGAKPTRADRLPCFPYLPRPIILNVGHRQPVPATQLETTSPRTVMSRVPLCLTLVFASLFASSKLCAQVGRPRLIDETAAARHGLNRAWFGHV